MQLSFQDTISFKLLHSNEEGCLVKTLYHKVLNGPSELEQKQRSYLGELVFILTTNCSEIIQAQFLKWNERGIGGTGKVQVLILKLI